MESYRPLFDLEGMRTSPPLNVSNSALPASFEFFEGDVDDFLASTASDDLLSTSFNTLQLQQDGASSPMEYLFDSLPALEIPGSVYAPSNPRTSPSSSSSLPSNNSPHGQENSSGDESQDAQTQKPVRVKRESRANLTADERAALRAEANKRSAALSRERRKAETSELSAKEAELQKEHDVLVERLRQRNIENAVLAGQVEAMQQLFKANPVLSSMLKAQQEAQNAASESKMDESFQRMLRAIELPAGEVVFQRRCQTPEEANLSKTLAGVYLKLALATELQVSGALPDGTPPVLAAAIYAAGANPVSVY